ncbi:MAG: AAA family ATPase [Chlamydiales bacterium]|nr:AAA family ATPase [Chlamydiales bacterium]
MSRLDNLIGNQTIKEQLKTIIKEKKFPSTMLFEGPAGVGKKRFAKAFAIEIMNTSKQDPIDFFHLYPDEKSGMHSMEEIRELIRNIALLPHEAPFKFYLIENIHAMLPIHANALLKTLEEPPRHAKIILTTDNKEDVLDTILSRCVIFSFQHIKEDEIVSFLMKEKHLDDISAKKIAFALNGSLEHIHFYLNDKLKPLEGFIKNMLKTYFAGHVSKAFSLLEEIDVFIQKQSNTDYELCVKLLLDYILFWYRDALLLQHHVTAEIFFHEEVAFLKELSYFKQLSLDKFSSFALAAKDALLRNIKVKYIVENFLLSTPQMMDVI